MQWSKKYDIFQPEADMCLCTDMTSSSSWCVTQMRRSGKFHSRWPQQLEIMNGNMEKSLKPPSVFDLLYSVTAPPFTHCWLLKQHIKPWKTHFYVPVMVEKIVMSLFNSFQCEWLWERLSHDLHSSRRDEAWCMTRVRVPLKHTDRQTDSEEQNKPFTHRLCKNTPNVKQTLLKWWLLR